MIAKRAVFLSTAFLFFFLLLPLNAQEADAPENGEEERPPESIWNEAPDAVEYQAGDQVFGISLGLSLPMMFYGYGGKMVNNFSLGGAGMLSYDVFLNSGFALGGEVMGMFTGTLSKSMYYVIPIGVRATYQFGFRSFEFPLTLSLGVAPQKYGDDGFFGPYAKAAASVYWRVFNDWSFGVNAAWILIPQWKKLREETAYGHFMGITLSARYHL